jgi:hypothetical protein
MKRSLPLLIALFFLAGHAFAQEFVPTTTPKVQSTPAPTPVPPAALQPKPQRRSWFNRMLHPFGSSKRSAPTYQNPKLRGLMTDLQISPETVKLSEVRQLEIKLIVSNQDKRTAVLDFPTDQRIEIYLLNSTGSILTRWSENHAIKTTPGTVLINPGEHVEYNETIATRDLTPNRVFTVEAFFPNYPELRVRQKFLTAP